MKTITKKLTTLGVVSLGLLLGGCAQSNEATMTTDPTTGKATAPGVTPASAPKSSKAAFEGMKSPMQSKDNSKAYKDSQG